METILGDGFITYIAAPDSIKSAIKTFARGYLSPLYDDGLDLAVANNIVKNTPELEVFFRGFSHNELQTIKTILAPALVNYV